jgi:hypothetical protein
MPTELRLPVGTVSAWAGTADGALLLAQDIDLRLIALPQLEVVASTCIENNIRRIAVHADGTWAALAIGSSGNYETHGNLLRLEIPSLQCDRMLDIDREVAAYDLCSARVTRAKETIMKVCFCRGTHRFASMRWQCAS